MDDIEGKEGSSAVPKRRRRSKLERLQDEKQRLIERLAATNQKRQAIEEELKQAEAQARQIMQKARIRDTLLIGAAFLRLLEEGDIGAHGLKAAVLKNVDKASRARVWRAFKLHALPTTNAK